MSTCGRCQASIVWVPKPGQAGGYFRPLEKVDIEGAGTLYVVAGANLLQVQDSLLQWHVCAEDRPPMPKIVVDDPDELDELAPGPERPLTEFEERELALERGLAKVAAEQQARIDADLARYAKAKADKVHAPYDRIACPRCHVPAGDPCRSLGSPAREKPTSRAHEARRAVYDGGTDHDEGVPERPNPQPYGAGEDEMAALLWPFHTPEPARALRAWLFDYSALLTDLGAPDEVPAS